MLRESNRSCHNCYEQENHSDVERGGAPKTSLAEIPDRKSSDPVYFSHFDRYELNALRPDDAAFNNLLSIRKSPFYQRSRETRKQIRKNSSNFEPTSKQSHSSQGLLEAESSMSTVQQQPGKLGLQSANLAKLKS